jgi:hypothetical protein
MAIVSEQFFSRLYCRLSDTDRHLCICTTCRGHISVRSDVDFRTEPCPVCDSETLSELSESEFARLLADDIESNSPCHLPSSSTLLSAELGAISLWDDPESQDWFRVQRQLVESLEGFADKQTARLINEYLKGRNVKLLEYLLDDYYTRDFLKKVKKMVKRTIRLDTAAPVSFPNREINLCLREATRCWILSLWDSSVALSRIVLELALRNLLQEKSGYVPPGPNYLEQLITAAGKLHLLDRIDVADDVRRKANRVVHGDAHANAELAEEVLFNVRGILRDLYSGS